MSVSDYGDEYPCGDDAAELDMDTLNEEREREREHDEADTREENQYRRYRLFRLVTLVYALMVVSDGYMINWIFYYSGLKSSGVPGVAGGNFMSYLNNYISVVVLIYSVVSAAPMIFPSLAQ
ncbi:hypothetical protein KIPB_012346, partial [Kipferlia bialata]|eukprot:g12346.t1